MMNVGIIGLGPVWEMRYRPALERLGRRIRACAVYDQIALRAEQVAAELDAVPFHGMWALLENPQVQAVLLLDAGWQGAQVFEFLLQAGKPAYVAGSLGEDVEQLRRLHGRADAQGLILMPEFSLRYTPATSRLQELIATRLGRPTRTTIEAVAPRPDDPDVVPGQGPGTDFLVGLLDWCCYVMRRPPVLLEAEPREPADAVEFPACRVRIAFASSRTGDPPIAELHVRSRTPEEAQSVPGVQYEVVCEQGTARLTSPAEITWSGADGPNTESLTSDRSAIEVTLDQFCRRVVGGLVPIADVADVCRNVALTRAVEESLRTGGPVELGEW